jgi:hypothetical protein
LLFLGTSILRHMPQIIKHERYVSEVQVRYSGY